MCLLLIEDDPKLPRCSPAGCAKRASVQRQRPANSGAHAHRPRGLNSGADDYLCKPFDFEELLARLHALLRRVAPEKDFCLRAGDRTLDPQKRTVTRAGRPVDLTAKEFAILEYLLRHKGSVISRTTLREHARDENFYAMSNVVDVTIYRLREKSTPTAPPLVHTVRGAGYVVREE